MSRGNLIGLDFSLRAPAYCVVPLNWKPGDWDNLGVFYRLTEYADLKGVERVEAIVDHVSQVIRTEDVVSGFVENYPFSYNSRSVTTLAELGGALKFWVRKEHKIDVVPVVASSARKLLFGKQHKMARKEIKAFVQNELQKMGAPFGNEDICDAFVIANAGLSILGLPCLAQE